MLSKLILTLSCENEINVSHHAGSAFQGVLMQSISPAYADSLHSMRSNPYSQYVMRGADGLRWTVCTTTREAHGQIIEALQSDAFRGFRLEQFGAELTVTDKSAETLPLKDLTHRFYHEDSDRFFRLRFLTPTAFKSKERYVFFPNIRLIFRSLMSKYSVAAEDTDEVDEDMLSELTEKAAIVEYSLRSVRYSVEQTKIPSFMGELAIKVSGAQTLANYVRLLLCFGEYSGIGIKCSMGMGAVSLLDRRTGERRF